MFLFNRCGNLIHRYDSTTGTFTVPPGGNGFYYFSAYFQTPGNEYGYFNIEINGEMLCTALGDTQDLSVIEIHTACNAAALAVEGTKLLLRGLVAKKNRVQKEISITITKIGYFFFIYT